MSADLMVLAYVEIASLEATESEAETPKLKPRKFGSTQNVKKQPQLSVLMVFTIISQQRNVGF